MHDRRGRFAPSTTGRAHPGTLLAALLCWLDARSRGAEVLLRLEDLDRERTKPGYVEAMSADLAWFGLDWDGVSRQSECLDRYDERLDALVAVGRVYACHCSRSQIRKSGQLAPDGSYRYAGACRDRIVQGEDWRRIDLPLRLRLDDGAIDLRDESGIDLSGDAAALFGDPLVRRRDGAYAYHFTSVLDDDADGVGRIVRGKDLAASTSLQVRLRRQLGFEIPEYRHHALLLESSGGKFSKFHGAVDIRELEERYDAPELCGLLAHIIGLLPTAKPCLPVDFIDEFDWSRVSRTDVELAWSSESGLSRV